MKALIVCQEQIDAGMSRARQLNCVCTAEVVGCAQAGKSPRKSCASKLITSAVDRTARSYCSISEACPSFVGFTSNLAERHCRGHDAITPLQHPAPEFLASEFGMVPQAFEHIDEHICVEEYPAQEGFSRVRSTYSSACSSAHICCPDPIRPISGSSSQSNLCVQGFGFSCPSFVPI